MNLFLRNLGIVTTLTICQGVISPGLIGQEKARAVVPSPVKVAPGKLVGAGALKAAQVKQGAAAKKRSSKAPQPRPGVGSGGNSWFPVTKRDLGTFYGQGEAVGTFEFTNPHDEAIEWTNLTASCQCANAVIRVGDRMYKLTNKPKRQLFRVTSTPGQPQKTERVKTITIGPGESGSVETHLDMRNITGPKQATLDIHSTDSKLPHAKLTFHAKGAQLFSISPKEINLNKMTWNESREFSVTVSSSMQEDWQILRMDDAGDAFDVTWEKKKVGQATAWTIKGKYGPVNGEVGGGGVLRFRTNVQGSASFTVRVLAFVQGPLEVKPGGFITLGLIRKGRTMTKEVTFVPNDGVDLQVTALEFQKMKLSTEFISAKSRKDGNKLVVEISISGDAPTGLVKGDLLVKLNHPLVKEKRIMFNGFVR